MVKVYVSRTGKMADILTENPSSETSDKIEKINAEFGKIITEAKNSFLVEYH